ncbi:hypothetical protein C0993_003791, partial [Termitomyces sp. T159_Od127]
AVTAAFQELKNLGEEVFNTTIGDHLLRHLDTSYYPVRTSILAQETEPNLEKIKSTLIGSASSEYIMIKCEAGLSARFDKDKGKGKNSHEPVTNGFKEGRYTWCEKANGDNCHRCGREGHISRLCAHDMPSAIKDLVLQGANDHACEKARYTYADHSEQDSGDDDDTQVIHADTSHAPRLL